MNTGVPQVVSRGAAALAAGGVIAVAIAVGTALCGSGPAACVASGAFGAAAVFGARWTGARRHTAMIAAGGAALALWRAEAVARALFASLPPATAYAATVAGLGLALTLFASPLGDSRALAGRGQRLLAGAWVVASPFLPREALLLVPGLALAVVALAPIVASERVARARALSAVACAVPVAAGVGVWVFRRDGLDPTLLGWCALAGGALIGGAAGAGRWRAAIATIAGVGIAALLVARPAEIVGLHAFAPDLVFLALGLAGGALVAGAGIDGGSAPAVALVAIALPFVLPLVPAEIAEKAATSLATTWAQTSRAEGIRAGTTLRYAGLGPAGGAILRAKDKNVSAELDGAFADPTSRAGDAERFAGTLAACFTSGRSRARVGGDDLGLAASALRAEGFLHLDAAVPDRGFLRALADASPALERLWLHPSVRLLSVPTPLLLRAGPTADAVVEIARSPWSGGRSSFPDAVGLQATRETLAPGGVHVLALAATGIDADVFHGVIRAFVATYPAASLWLPPSGVDTAILVGPREADARAPWSGFEKCVADDAKALDALALRSPVDVGALALADAGALRALPAGRAPLPGVPEAVRKAPVLLLSAFADIRPDLSAIFGPDAPTQDLDARADARALFLRMVDDAAGGDIRQAFEKAHALAGTTGGGRSLEPLVRGHLDRARDLMARAEKEGTTSPLWQQAEAALSTALFLYPDYADAHCLEGDMAGDRGQWPRAEDAYGVCAKLDPKRVDAWHGVARVRMARGNLVGAEQALRSAYAERPDVWTTSYRLGLLLEQTGRYDEAEKLLKFATAQQTRDGAAPVAAPLLALADLHLANDHAALALAEAQSALAIDRSADALARRGDARYELDQLDLAEADYRAALALDGRHVRARFGLGRVLATHKQYELAAAAFRAVLDVEPQNPAAQENLRRLAPHLQEAEEK